MIALIITVLTISALAVLLLPITISFNSVRSGETIEGTMGISWIIFLFNYALKEKQLEIRIFGRSVFRHISTEKKPQEPEHMKDGGNSGKTPPIRDILNVRGPLLQLFKDLVHAIRLKYFDIDITFGLNDPAYTGILTGFMHALRNSLSIGKGFKFTPDFTNKTLEWNVRGRATIIPISILASFVKFAANRRVLRFALLKIT